MSNEEEMIKRTKEMLGIEGEDDCLTPVKAIFNEEIGEKNILVLGLNPAGNKEDVKRENECDIYLKYVKGDNIELKSKLVYKKYFKPIYDLLSEIYDGNIKFSWCNIDEKTLEKRLNKYKKYVEKQKAEYKNENTKNLFEICQKVRKEKEKKDYTILIGELFYYHQTSSKDFIKKINDKDEDFHKNVRDMLDLHIKKVLSKGGTLEFILINNARASEYIIEALPEQKDSDTCYRYTYEDNKIPIFFSGMLSNGGESKYGKQRLINEIKKEKGIA